MTLAKKNSEDYIETPVRKPSKDGLMIISGMGSWRIVGFLLNRHRYGISLTVNFLIVGFLAWDKIGRWFF